MFRIVRQERLSAVRVGQQDGSPRTGWIAWPFPADEQRGRAADMQWPMVASRQRRRQGKTVMITLPRFPSTKISAVVSDVDGTLVTDDKILTARAQAAVAELRATRNHFYHHQQPTTARLAHVGRPAADHDADRRLQWRNNSDAPDFR